MNIVYTRDVRMHHVNITSAGGDNGPHLEIDATDWAWINSGRARGTGLLATPSRYDQRPAAGNRAPSCCRWGPASRVRRLSAGQACGKYLMAVGLRLRLESREAGP